MAVTPDGSKVYVANGANNVSVIATATNQVVPPAIPVGSGPYGVAVTPDGSKVYVANVASNNVSVIDTAKNTVTATIPVGSGPEGVAVSLDGSKVYIANYLAGSVSVIATATNQVVPPAIPVGSGPFGVAVSLDGSAVYVTNLFSNSVSVIDTASNTVTATIPDLPGPNGVAVTPDGSKVYVANLGADNIAPVSVIDTASNTVTATIPFSGNGPVNTAFGAFIGGPSSSLLKLAYASEYVYSGDAAPPGYYFLNDNCGTNCSTVAYRVAVYVSDDRTHVIFAFRGTVPKFTQSIALMKDLLEDQSFITNTPSTYLQGVVSGAALFVNREIAALEKAYGVIPENIYLTGHSLGGAIAQILSEKSGLNASVFDAPGSAVVYTSLDTQLAESGLQNYGVGGAVLHLRYPAATGMIGVCRNGRRRLHPRVMPRAGAPLGAGATFFAVHGIL